jgi:hypothetical protein
MLVAQCIQQRLFVNDASARHVHHDRLLRKPCDLTLGDHALGFVCQRGVNRQDIRLL